jgi:pimeloyl-ACP methyl ester carboxylesterase
MTLMNRNAQAEMPEEACDILLVMVPGMGMKAGDFAANGLIDEVRRRGWPIAVTTLDPGLDAYLDGSIETRLLDVIAAARRDTGTQRIWLAGISLGCQAILRCVRMRPDLAEEAILLTPYLASTGLIAEVGRAGGLRRWSASAMRRNEPERALLTWLATTPPGRLPRIMVGHAQGDRFATTATLLADLLPADRLASVAGAHDWASWRVLWRLILDRNPFGQRTPEVP